MSPDEHATNLVGSNMNPKKDDRPQLGWWAPGEYYNLCRKCRHYFIGDKRAGYCADCAYSSDIAYSD